MHLAGGDEAVGLVERGGGQRADHVRHQQLARVRAGADVLDDEVERRPAVAAALEPATTSMQVCFDQSATAVTTVTFINRPTDPTVDGRIIDADIDFNAVNFRFYDADQGPPAVSNGRSPVDLWNTVTHELGHVMGLEHPCSLFPGALAECVVDGQGVPVPDCSTVEQDRYRDLTLQTIYEATMYPTSAPGETTKRLPHADDVAGIITAYPKVKDPMTCKLPLVAQNAGCAAPATAAPRSAPLLAGALLGLVAALRALRALRARRRRVRP